MDFDSDNVAAVLCTLIEWGPPSSEAEPATCCLCNRGVWWSKSNQQDLAKLKQEKPDLEVRLVCLQCFKDRPEFENQHKMQMPGEETINEVSRKTGVAPAEIRRRLELLMGGISKARSHRNN